MVKRSSYQERRKMAERVLVVNKGDTEVKEYKPGIGNFVIKPGEKLEVFDYTSKVKLPNGKEIDYVYSTAREIANSIVADSGVKSLSVEIVKDAVKDAVKEVAKKEEKKEEKEKKE